MPPRPPARAWTNSEACAAKFFFLSHCLDVPDWAAAAAADFWAEKVISIWADNFFWAGPGRSTTVHHVAHFEPIFQTGSSVFFFCAGKT